MSGIRKRVVLTGGMVVAMTLLAGCLSSNDNGGGGGGAGGTASFVDGGSADNDKKVTMLGTFGGDEEKNFLAALAPFEKSSGIDIQYVADRDFATTIKQKVNSGDAPDIGLFAQPGGLLEFAADNKVQALDSILDVNALNSTLVPGLLDSAKDRGRVYGAPMKLAGKSLVWYPKKAYTAGGYATAPATMADLQGVADKIKASGTAPWCMGWESAQDTGWVGTDWIEQYVLGMHGPEVYDQWTSHKIPFNDPRIIQSFDAFAKIAKGDGYVLGGPKGVLSTPFGEAMLPAFAKPPQCFLERQGNFVTSFLPKNIQANLADEVGVFAFPQFENGFDGTAMVGAADMAALFNGNDPDAQAVMKFLASADFGKEWAKAGGWLSPHKTFDSSLYPDETTKQVADIVAKAGVFRFDGSDLMPKAVGSGTFWSELIKWENGQSSKETADNIEASWPKS